MEQRCDYWTLVQYGLGVGQGKGSVGKQVWGRVISYH
jgi:hypothetical protein